MGDKAQFTFKGFIWLLVENGVSPVVGGEEPELGAQREAPGRDDTGLAWAVRPWGKGDLRSAVTVVPRRQQQAHLSSSR